MASSNWKETTRMIFVGLVILMAPAAPRLLAQTGENTTNPVIAGQESAYDEAVFLETVDGDLKGAVAAYRRLLVSIDPGSDLGFRARSRLIGCMRRLGDKAGVKIESETLMRLFPDRAAKTSTGVAGAQGGVAGQAANLIALLGDSDAAVQQKARLDLIWFGEAVVPYLADALHGDSHYQALNAARCLRGIGGERGCEALRDALAGDDPIVRRNAMRGIELDTQAYNPRKGPYPVKPECLGSILREQVFADPDQEMRSTAIEILGRHGDSMLVENADRILLDTSPSVRSTLFTWLELRRPAPGPDKVRSLAALGVKDVVSTVRGAAVDFALETLRGDDALAILRVAARDADPRVRMLTALYANDACEGEPTAAPRALDVVLMLSDDPDPKVRANCVASAVRLAPMLGADDIGRLVSGIQPPLRLDHELRERTIRDLTKYPHPNAQTWILDCMKDPATFDEAVVYVERGWRDDWADPVPSILAGLRNRPLSGRGSSARVSSGGVGRVLLTHGSAKHVGAAIDLCNRLGPDTERGSTMDEVRGAMSDWISKDPAAVAAHEWTTAFDMTETSRERRFLGNALGNHVRSVAVEEIDSKMVGVLDRYARGDSINYWVTSPLANLAAAGREDAATSLQSIASDSELSVTVRVWAAVGLAKVPAREAEAVAICEAIAAESMEWESKKSLLDAILGSTTMHTVLRRVCAEDAVSLEYVLGQWQNYIPASRLQDKANGPLIEMALGHSATNIRELAVNLLGAMNDPAWTGSVIAATKDPEYVVRRKAAVALGTLRNVESVPVLVEMLRDADQGVRDRAKTALETIRFYNEQKVWWDEWKASGGAKSGVTKIVSMLDDPDRSVRLRAIGSLGSIGSPEALPNLLALLKDPDPEIRKAAGQAIDRINAGDE